MTNQILIDFAKKTIKELLSQCTEGQQNKFKLMYGDINKSIEEVVDKMPNDKLDRALTQCEYQVFKNKQHVF